VRSDSESQPSVPCLSVVPVCYGCKARLGSWPRCGRALQAAYPPWVIAGAGEGSAQGGRRHRRKHGGAATTATGNGVVCARSRSRRVLPQLTRGRREPVPPRVLRGVQGVLRAAGALLPVRLLAAADLAADGVRTLPGCREAYSYAPRSAILLPAMAGGAWRGNSAVYVGAFCANEKEGCQAPFQGPAEDGYQPQQDVRKTALCIDRARSIHKLIPGTPALPEIPSRILRRRGRRPWRET
jgi:hypothetical protein